MTASVLSQPSSSTTLVTRTLDAVDRAHARAAMVLHSVRNEVLQGLERAIDHAEEVATRSFDRARKGIQRADATSADLVNRAQGVVGQAIERARPERPSKPQMAS